MISARDGWPLSSFLQRLEESERFHLGEGLVHQTLRALVSDLEQAGIDYAVVGALALNAHGYARETTDIALLVSPSGLGQFEKTLVGRGYLPVFSGARKSFRATRTNVRIEFLTTGEFPGDGRPKPIAFPEPNAVSEVASGIHIVRLPVLIELKLASGMTNPGRLRDLADVQELIRVLELPRDYSDQLHPYVRAKFSELWTAVHDNPA